MSSLQPRIRGEDSPSEFDAVLRQLKRDGCHLLVTGDVDGEVAGRATRRLLGDPNRERERVLAVTDATADHVDHCLPAGVRRTDPDVWVADPTGSQRSVPADAADVELPADCADRSALGRLRAELVQAVGFFDDVRNGLSPAELRVGVTSVTPLLDAHDRGTVGRFLRAVGAIVRGVDGMAHAHLSLPDDHPTVDDLSPLFDARIELRRREGLVPEQRWHVPKHDITSDWTKL